MVSSMTKVVLNHVEGMRFIGETENHAIVLESGYFGEQKGPSPMATMLLALGGCTGMDVIAILTKMKQKPEKFRIEIESERAEQHPKVYTKVHLKYIFAGVDYEKAKKAVELSQNKYCSVSAMFRNAGVDISYEILFEN